MTTPSMSQALHTYLQEVSGHRLGSLASLIPQSFAHVIRVLSPALVPGGRRLHWSDLTGDAIAIGSETQWNEVVAAASPDLGPYLEPDMGTINGHVAQSLLAILSRHTSSQEATFLVWEGYSGLKDEVARSPTVTAGLGRVMHVRHGALSLALDPIDSPPNRLAMTWLPDDGAWFVGNDIYARSVFVGGSAECIGAVLSQADLEAYPVGAGYSVAPEDF
ncbi:hypothetical protein StoSoilA2_43720 [Arthrobacter sp. StoSoilA2]|uniref:hypothetical protein n=1 Tax=unclassified Arthrobacter TaxID=235627 RepID=UPI001CC4C66B|nr:MULTISPECIES: hypothetical protein [unclassified Arthrobacter]MDR6686526.1 hypothetical protein [Arthrobacter sp. 1088]BCW38316.1 hypothetical protein StoSoilA2_43720 [Arthrobacter sp. StoSoilA2]